MGPEVEFWLVWPWSGNGFEKVSDGAAVHEVCADERGEGERAGDEFGSVVGQSQQQECDQRDRNLNANRVFGSSEEVANLQGLFDPSKEQLDSPSPLVQVGDVLRAGVEIIGEDAQHLAGIVDHSDFADETRHWVATRCGEPLGKIPGPIAEHRASWRDRPILNDL